MKYRCIGKNKDESPCGFTATKGFYCKKHQPVYPKIILAQNKDGSLSKRNKLVIKKKKENIIKKNFFIIYLYFFFPLDF